MADQSLITDELRSYIGRSTSPRPVRVTLDLVRRSAGVYGAEVPPDLEDGDPVSSYVLMGLSPEGEGESLRLPDPLPKSLLVSNEFAAERRLCLGEEFVAQSRIADISERLGGQFGHGIYVRSETEFRDASGDVVGRTASTLMHYDPAGARRGGDE